MTSQIEKQFLTRLVLSQNLLLAWKIGKDVKIYQEQKNYLRAAHK